MLTLWQNWLHALLAPNSSWVTTLADISLVLLVTFLMLSLIGERQTLWMVRGFVILMLVAFLSKTLALTRLNFLLNNLVLGAALAMAMVLQSEIRRFLEQLGRGQLLQLFSSRKTLSAKSDVVDEVVDAVKELSQNRTGALIIVETADPIDERDFSVPGVKLNAELSKELLQTIFQTSTLLHDGAVLMRGSRIVAASVILPISERTAARRLGTRHRAAMGITERVENCICVVVSEETGSISLAERGILNRPLTSSKLRELLQNRLSQSVELEAVAPDLRNLSRRLSGQSKRWFSKTIDRLRPSASRERK